MVMVSIVKMMVFIPKIHANDHFPSKISKIFGAFSAKFFQHLLRQNFFLYVTTDREVDGQYLGRRILPILESS